MLTRHQSRWICKEQLPLHSKHRAAWTNWLHLAGKVAFSPASREPRSPRRVGVLGTEGSGGYWVQEHLPWHRSPAGHSRTRRACLLPLMELGGGKTSHCLVPPGMYCGLLSIKVKLSDNKVRGSGKWENEGELLLQKLRGASMRGCASGAALSN